ncbi:hypothetical protein [Actinoplanes campanulatus]|nr:hypothetical protein [Actinoplanes capillaceus]
MASDECRACLRIVCAACDGGFLPDLAPICGPCTPPPSATTTVEHPGFTHTFESYGLCIFEFDLSCGHLVTVAVTGWFPVAVSCCSRLGGTIKQGEYVPFASAVDYARVLVQNFERRPRGTRCPPIQIIGRRPRTDEPHPPSHHGFDGSSGRFPNRVGAARSLDGSIAAPKAG